jgi:hypothetical protein
MDQNERINPHFPSFKMAFLLHVGMLYDIHYCITYIKYISHVKIQLFVTAKSNQDQDSDPDPP